MRPSLAAGCLFVTLRVSSALAQDAVKPYLLVIVDTSSSMNECSSGVGTSPCPGTNSCGHEPSKMSDAKCVVQQIVDGYGDVTFGLERYDTPCSGGTGVPCTNCCATNCCTCSNACTVNPGDGEVIVDIREGNQDEIRRWVDYNIAACDSPTDPELMIGGGTPLEGSLNRARLYYEGNDTSFPISPIAGDPYRLCRPYRVILLTDGVESCMGSPTTAATALRSTMVGTDTYDIRTYVVGFGVPDGDPNIENIAQAGGTDAPGPWLAAYASSEASLSLAMSQIIQESILAEICDGADNDCDGLTDEGWPTYCDIPSGVTMPTLCVNPYDPVEPCDGIDDNCYLGTDDEARNSCGLCGPECQCAIELCNAIDDDCDGQTDEGYDLIGPCDGPDADLCTNGTKICGGCMETIESLETCNNLDDNCNGLTDEFLTRACASSCGPGMETCTGGNWVNCSAPDAQPEVCDCQDNDCNGQTDESTCGAPSVCLPVPYCQCAIPCGNEELCPPGTVPSDPDLDSPDCFCQPDTCAGVDCPLTKDGVQVCVDGACLPICDVNHCIAPLVCDPVNGACVAECGNCPDGQACVDGKCVDDPCVGVDCPDDRFCREGECVKSCANVVCPDGQSCHDGACAVDRCATVSCPRWQVCDPATGTCRHDPCIGVHCAEGQTCDTTSGACVVDPCLGIDCPLGEACRAGDCWTPAQAAGERPQAPAFVDISGEGGCACAAGRDPSAGGSWILLLVVLAPMLRRVRWLRLLALSALAACDATPFCANCDPIVVVPADAAPDGSDETCNGADDDRNGLTDENLTQPCGITQGACRSGTQSCVAGAWGPCAGQIQADLEVCDEIDNDCNGETDENFDLDNDPTHCGDCDTVCAGFHATSTCVLGAPSCPDPDKACCQFTCEVDWWDADMSPNTGCEYACTFVDDEEACNGVDEDCDGQADEAPVMGLGVQCTDFGLEALGDEGECTFGVSACVAGAVDCAGYVGPTQEMCDGEDDDCDGNTDNGFPGLGQTCTRGTGACATVGQIVCNPTMDDIVCNAPPETSGSPEVCNGIDDNCNDMTDENAADEWVQFSGAFGTRWIYRYEASRPDATDMSTGSMVGGRPCSAQGRLPWVNITYPQAQAACADVGARLCTEAEWERACQTAAATCTWSYAAACTVYDPDNCNGDNYDVDLGVPLDQDRVLPGGSLAQCYADWGSPTDRVFDLSGNAKEWAQARAPGENPLRGGSTSNTANGISCTYDFVIADDTFLFDNVGFRCCRDTAPP